MKGKIGSGLSEVIDRYAKALFECILDDPYKGDVKEKLLKNLEQTRVLRLVLQDLSWQKLLSPLYTLQEKLEWLETLSVALKLDQELTNFLKLVMQNKRFVLILDILQKFQDYVDEYMGILRAEILVPQTLSEELILKYEELLSQSFAKKVVLLPKIDENLLAGSIVRVRNLVIDASLRSHLRALYDALR